MVKNPPANAGDIRDTGLIPGSGRSPGRGHSNPLQYSCLEKSMNKGTWVTTQGVTKELDMTEGTKHMSFSSASVSKTQGNLKVCPSLLPGMHKGTRSIKLGEMKEEKEMKEGEAETEEGGKAAGDIRNMK